MRSFLAYLLCSTSTLNKLKKLLLYYHVFSFEWKTNNYSSFRASSLLYFLRFRSVVLSCPSEDSYNEPLKAEAPTQLCFRIKSVRVIGCCVRQWWWNYAKTTHSHCRNDQLILPKEWMAFNWFTRPNSDARSGPVNSFSFPVLQSDSFVDRKWVSWDVI